MAARHIERPSENPQGVVAGTPADKPRIPLMAEPGRPGRLPGKLAPQ